MPVFGCATLMPKKVFQLPQVFSLKVTKKMLLALCYPFMIITFNGNIIHINNQIDTFFMSVMTIED